MLSFIEFKDKQPYLNKIHITNGAVKQSKKVIENVPINGIRVTNPKTTPKNMLNMEICLSKVKSKFIKTILTQKFYFIISSQYFAPPSSTLGRQAVILVLPFCRGGPADFILLLLALFITKPNGYHQIQLYQE